LANPQVTLGHSEGTVIVNIHYHGYGHFSFPGVITKSFAQGMAGYPLSDFAGFSGLAYYPIGLYASYGQRLFAVAAEDVF
jgi:hypothetical protein